MGRQNPLPSPHSTPGTGSPQLATRLFTAWLALKTALKPFSINEINTGPPTRPHLFPRVPASWGGMQSWGREDRPLVFPASLFLSLGLCRA